MPRRSCEAAEAGGHFFFVANFVASGAKYPDIPASSEGVACFQSFQCGSNHALCLYEGTRLQNFRPLGQIFVYYFSVPIPYPTLFQMSIKTQSRSCLFVTVGIGAIIVSTIFCRRSLNDPRSVFERCVHAPMPASVDIVAFAQHTATGTVYLHFNCTSNEFERIVAEEPYVALAPSSWQYGTFSRETFHLFGQYLATWPPPELDRGRLYISQPIMAVRQTYLLDVDGEIYAWCLSTGH